MVSMKSVLHEGSSSPAGSRKRGIAIGRARALFRGGYSWAAAPKLQSIPAAGANQYYAIKSFNF